MKRVFRSAALVTEDRLLTHRLLPVSFLSLADDVLLLGVLVVLLSAVLESLPFESLVLLFVSLSLERNKKVLHG